MYYAGGINFRYFAVGLLKISRKCSFVVFNNFIKTPEELTVQPKSSIHSVSLQWRRGRSGDGGGSCSLPLILVCPKFFSYHHRPHHRTTHTHYNCLHTPRSYRTLHLLHECCIKIHIRYTHRFDLLLTILCLFIVIISLRSLRSVKPY